MSESTAVKSLITPLDQTLRTVFNAQRSYFIDIFQREYKWTQANVRTLLEDIELRFSQHERRAVKPKEIQEDVIDRFEPYFLNTYLTSTTAAYTSIVDGQQRLTTFLLILIKFYRLLQTLEGDPANQGRTFSSQSLKKLISETNDFGDAERFKIFNPNREAAFRALALGESVDTKDQTRTRMAENYETISRYYDEFLLDQATSGCDLAKTTYYLTYLLDRISIVEIRIERQENVATIFEVVNDRGEPLRSYEILKGKLIGNLNGGQKEEANEVWTDLQERYFRARLQYTTETTIDLDTFFRAFFRAKFADTENDYERFEGKYHQEMYRDPKIRAYFGDFRDRDLLFSRIVGDLRYFADLYLELRTSYEHEPLIFNKLLDQNQQYLLILSATVRDDPDRSEKIRLVAAKFDQFHTVLRLLKAYDSNVFQRLVYQLNREVRDRPLPEVRAMFEKTLLKTLVDSQKLPTGQFERVEDIFEFERFKVVSNDWVNFSKYVLLRIDRWLWRLLDKPSYAGGDLRDLEERFNKNNRKRYGMHLEHIYTRHEANCALFLDANGILDETRFQETRNLLGMVLLLKDSQNISSNDEVYSGKEDTYSKSNVIWNELLVGHLPSVDERTLPDDLRFAPIHAVNDVFPLDQVENRQKAVFTAIRHLWGNV